jgi:D-alanine transaminase
VERNGGGNQAVYLQVTRGVAPREHAFPDAASPTVFVMTRKLDGDPPAHGLHAVTRTDIRWSRCDIKSVALLPNVLMRQEAGDSSASEAILIRDGMLTEGTSSNVFVVDGRGLRTPPKSAQILAGITRDVLIELAAAAHMECREEAVSETELRAADEIWLSSSTKEVVPVVRLDGRPVGGGAPGAAWRRMHELLQDYKRRLLGGDVD